jgi:two-component system LytT family response regulator/two-component system response regulator LytT
MSIRTVVVDDEQLARHELCFQLEQLEGVEIIGQAGDGLQALAVIEALHPDLVLLDIQMPGRTGFEVARELVDRDNTPRVVFVTAYDQHAIEAFEVNAVDYLLKPVEPARLARTIGRVRELVAPPPRSGAQPTALQADDLERIVDLVAQRQGRREPIAVKVGERLVLVQPHDIVFASLVDDVITVVTGTLNGAASCRTLDELQSHLDPDVFWRVHRSHVVNIHKIKEIVPWFSRNYILKMKDSRGTEIPVSRSQTKRLREYLSL